MLLRGAVFNVNFLFSDGGPNREIFRDYYINDARRGEEIVRNSSFFIFKRKNEKFCYRTSISRTREFRKTNYYYVLQDKRWLWKCRLNKKTDAKTTYIIRILLRRESFWNERYNFYIMCINYCLFLLFSLFFYNNNKNYIYIIFLFLSTRIPF